MKGVDISVVLTPPFVMLGLAVGNTDFLLFSKSLLIVFLNVIEIMIGSAITFSAIKRYAKH